MYNKLTTPKNYVHYGVNFPDAGWNGTYEHIVYGDGNGTSAIDTWI